MRNASLFAAIVFISVALAGCSQKSEQASSTSTSATAAASEAAVNLKVPLYPGASSKHFTNKSTGGGVTRTTNQTALQTSDSFDKVYAWYKERLTGWNDTGGVRTQTNGAGTSKNGAFRSGSGANATVVGITSVPSGTWVSILETTTK